MLPCWCQDTVELIRPSWVEKRGTLVPDWDHPSSQTIGGCYLCPEAGSADLDGRNNTVQPWSLYAPAGTSMAMGDRVVWQGRTFEVAAPPEVRRDPFSSLDHVKVPLAERKG